MTVILLLFARAREVVGASRIYLELPKGARIKDLRHQLAQDYPALKDLLSRSAIGIDGVFAGGDSFIPENAEVALLPPVSGG